MKEKTKKGKHSRLSEVLADRRAAFSEKKRAVQEMKNLGEVVGERYVTEMEACDILCEKLFACVENPERFERQEIELLRDGLKAINSDLRYSVLLEVRHHFPERSVSLFALCFGNDRQWDEDLIDLLEHEPNEGTPDLFILWLGQTKEKSLAKRIRKALHTLRTRGIAVPVIDGSNDRHPVWIPFTPPKSEGFVSLIDSTGTRIVWLLRHRHPRGFFLFYALIHEHSGLIDFEPMELSSKQAEAYKKQIREKEELCVVEADPAYCAFLIHEAHERTPVKEGPATEAYALVKALVEEVSPHDTPSPQIYAVMKEEDSAEDLMGETRKLLDHKLLTGWRLEEETVKPFSSRLKDIQESKIILNPLQKRDRVESFYVQSAREAFSVEATRHLWKRRLEETAWVFYKNGHEHEARLAVRVATLLSHASEDPSKSPFIMELTRRSLDQSLEATKRQDALQPFLIVKP